MKKQNLITTSVAIFGLIVVSTFGSCKKDETTTTTPAPPTKTDLLTTGAWKMTAMSMTIPGGISVDLYAQMDDCEKDDLLDFKKDNTVVMDDGPTKCDPNDPQTETDTWTFYDNEKILIVGTGSEADTMNIDVLSTTALELSLTEYDSTMQGDIVMKAKFVH